MCLSEASLARPRQKRVAQGTRSFAAGRGIRLPFSLVTFFWASKRKLLRSRAHNPTKQFQKKSLNDKTQTPRRHHSSLPRTRHRRPLLHPPVGRPWRPRHQDRAPRQRRLRPCLRHPCQRPSLALCLDQPKQRKPDTGPQAPRCFGCTKSVTDQGGCPGAKPGPRRCRPHGPGL